MALRWIKYQVTVLTGNDSLFKKKKLTAKRPKVAKTKAEKLQERQWMLEHIDRQVRAQLRIFLTNKEVTAMGLAFDRFSNKFGLERLANVEFIQMILQGSGAGGLRENELSKNLIKGLLDIFSHSQVRYRKHHIIPGRDHPYLLDREKRTVKYKVGKKVEKIQKVLRRRPEEDVELSEEEREKAAELNMHENTIDLHEFILSISYWKRMAHRYENHSEIDDVTYFFWLFDFSMKKVWTIRDFSEAMRTLLVALYVSEHEDGLMIPSDCDPQERLLQEERENRYKTIEEMEAEEKGKEKERKKRTTVEKYLDIVFDDIDKAKLEIIDLEDVSEWIQENVGTELEFAALDPEKEEEVSRLELAFKAVGSQEMKLDREQFYAFVENTHMLSFVLNDRVEVKFFELSKKIAEREFTTLNETGISLAQFRQFLRNFPDVRLAPMVVRVANIMRKMMDHVDPSAVDAIMRFFNFQINKPKFLTLSNQEGTNNLGFKKDKKLQSKSLTTLRKAYLKKSPLAQVRIAPFPDAVPESVF